MSKLRGEGIHQIIHSAINIPFICLYNIFIEYITRSAMAEPSPIRIIASAKKLLEGKKNSCINFNIFVMRSNKITSAAFSMISIVMEQNSDFIKRSIMPVRTIYCSRGRGDKNHPLRYVGFPSI